MTQLNQEQVNKLVADGYTFICNHSGGKDSQAMLIEMVKTFQIPTSSILVVHADLGRFEWGKSTNTIASKDHAAYSANVYGLGLAVVSSQYDLFDLCRKYKRWPSGQARFCTSELKTRPIVSWIKGQELTKIVNCMGIRAEESPNRAQGLDKPCYETSGQASAFAPDKKLSTKGRVGFTWYPIFELSTEQVFDIIKDAGQEPHEAYTKYGMSRLSCVFCVMASKGDLQNAAGRAPELLDEYVALEKEINKTVFAYRKNKQAVLISMRDYLARPLMRHKKIWKWADSVAKWLKV